MDDPGYADALENRREHRRFPAWIDCSLTGLESRTSAPATIVDLSLGGALLQTHQGMAPGATAALSILSPLGPLALRGQVVRGEASWTGYLLHLEFETAGPAVRLALCRLLDDLELDFRRRQLGLAGPMRRP